jgi:hypothetical protein
MLTSQETSELQHNVDLIWHKKVPLKVSIFAWRLLRDRLPTRFNLANRGIIATAARLCVAGCGHVEDTTHLFLWPLVRDWIGFVGVDSQVLSDHLLQFIHYTGAQKERRSFLHMIWLLCVWTIWNERNCRLFKNKECSIIQLLDKIKSQSLWWLKTCKANFVYGTQFW